MASSNRNSIDILDVYDDDSDISVFEDSKLLNTPDKSNTFKNVLGLPIENSPLETLQEKKAHFTYFQLMALSAYWFGWAALWMPLLVILMPAQIVNIAGEANKGHTLGTTLLLGSGVSLICSPVFGAVSDQCRHWLGRRRPLMIIGGVMSTVALIFMAYSTTLAGYSFAFFFLSVANNLIVSPYSALVPDVVPESQRGIASGWLGGFSMLGNLVGGFATYMLPSVGIVGCYFILIAIHALSIFITVYYTKEEPLTTLAQPFVFAECFTSFFHPLFIDDFRWLLFTRFLIQMGVVTVQENLAYYVKDAIPSYDFNGTVLATSSHSAVSVLFLPLLIGALFASIASGFLSDYYQGKRKFLVYISGAIMSTSGILFAFTRSFAFDLFLSFAFGVGFGVFSAIDWAMATDCLPSKQDVAKDMGLWSLAFIMPQVVAAPIAGNLLDYFEKIHPSYHIGYSIVFSLSSCYFALGTYLIKKINAVK